MKKSLLLLAVMCLCGIAQAATISWSVAGKTFGKSPDDLSGNKRPYNYTVMVFDAANYSTIEAALKAGKVSSITGLALSSGVTGKTGATSGNFTESEASRDIFAVAFDSSSADAALNYSIGDTITAQSYEPPSPAPDVGWEPGKGNWNDTWHPVPEPTTAALLALGLAAFGLKRKVRA